MNRKFISNSNYVFRKILNSEESLSILKNFIEAILNIKIEEIELNPYLTKKEKYLPSEEKFGIADVRIKTNENEEMNVGIQFIDGIYVQTKMLLYYSQIHLNQQEYDDNREFAKTITINLLDFNYFASKEYEKTIRIKTNQGDIQLEEIEMKAIELPKFRKANPDMNEKINQWLAFIDDDNKELVNMAESKNETLKKARVEMNYLTGDAEVRRLAELREKWEMDRINAISHATKVGKEERNKGKKQTNS